MNRAGSDLLQMLVWAHTGQVPGLARTKDWVAVKVRVDGFLDPGTPVWDAITADGQELGIVIPQARERGIVDKPPVAEPTSTHS